MHNYFLDNRKVPVIKGFDYDVSLVYIIIGFDIVMAHSMDVESNLYPFIMMLTRPSNFTTHACV